MYRPNYFFLFALTLSFVKVSYLSGCSTVSSNSIASSVLPASIASKRAEDSKPCTACTQRRMHKPRVIIILYYLHSKNNLATRTMALHQLDITNQSDFAVSTLRIRSKTDCTDVPLHDANQVQRFKRQWKWVYSGRCFQVAACTRSWLRVSKKSARMHACMLMIHIRFW